MRRFSPEPKPIHNHSTLERGSYPPNLPSRWQAWASCSDTHIHLQHTPMIDKQHRPTCGACIRYENTHSLRHINSVCQVSIRVVVFFCADWSQWPDENVILHCVLNGSTWELSEGWGHCKETQTCIELLVFTVVTALQYIVASSSLFCACYLPLGEL